MLMEQNLRFESSNRQMQAAVRENQELREQIVNLSQTTSKFEGIMKKKEAEIIVLRAELKQESGAREKLENEKAALERELEGVAKRIEIVEDESASLRKRMLEVQLEREAFRGRLRQKDEEEGQTRAKQALVRKEEMKILRERVNEAERSLRMVADVLDKMGSNNNGNGGGSARKVLSENVSVN
ncbi:hypothetical protein V1522DRAFT_413613 [Lipomyces starkeyi]